MTTKRVRMSKQELNRAYQNRMRRALSGQEIDDIARPCTRPCWPAWWRWAGKQTTLR